MVKDRDHVAQILLVERDDLKLGEQQLCEREGQWIDRDPAVDRDLVTHAKRAHEDVELTLVYEVVEQQPLVPVNRVKLLLRLPAHLLDEPGHQLPAPLERHEIDVLVLARQAGVEGLVGPDPHRQSTYQPERYVALERRCRQTPGLVEDLWKRCLGAHRVTLAPRRSPRAPQP